METKSAGEFNSRKAVLELEKLNIMNSYIHSNKWLWLSLMVAAIATMYIQIPNLLDPLRVDEDFRNLYWVNQIEDPSLYVDDLLIGNQIFKLEFGDYTIIYSKFSPGYGILFTLLSRLFPPILLSKLLLFPLLLISIFYLYRICESIIESQWLFGLCVFFTIFMLMAGNDFTPAAGLQRSFVLPLVLATMYYLMKRRYVVASSIVFLGVIYPPAFVLNAVLYGLTIIRNNGIKRPSRQLFFDMLPLFVTIFLGLLMLLPVITTVSIDEQVATDEQVKHLLLDPKYRQGGRYPLFVTFPFFGDGGLFKGGVIGVATVIMIILSMGVRLVLNVKVQKIPVVIWNLMWASIICFSLSWLAIFFTSSLVLHMPNRYTRSTLFLIALIFLFANADQFFHTTAIWLRAQGGRVIWYVLPIAIAAVIYSLSSSFPGSLKSIMLVLITLLFILALLQTIRIYTKMPTRNDLLIEPQTKTRLYIHWVITALVGLIVTLVFLSGCHYKMHGPSEDTQKLLSFLESLPKDVLIYGDPCSLDDVPLYAKRKVLFSCETPNPDPSMMLEGLQAYYAASLEEVHDFCNYNNIDYLVVNQNSYANARLGDGDFFYEPFDSFLKSSIDSRETFALENISDDKKLFQQSDLFVIACGSIKLSEHQ